MKELYTIFITIIGTLMLFGVLSVIAYNEQVAINEEQAKQGWCNVQMGKSVATVECIKIEKVSK